VRACGGVVKLVELFVSRRNFISYYARPRAKG
jgi:hypothetical protein